jgi:hypothetical protein
MQLCTGGDLFTYLLHHIDTRARLSEGETKYIMFQLFKALSYLHRQNIAHRGEPPSHSSFRLLIGPYLDLKVICCFLTNRSITDCV